MWRVKQHSQVFSGWNLKLLGRACAHAHLVWANEERESAEGGWTKRCHSCYRLLLYPSRQRGAVINKLCDSSYRHHPLWHTQTRARAHTHGNDHSIPRGHESPGRTRVQVQHPSCFPLFFSPFFTSFDLRYEIVSPAFSCSLCLLPSPVSPSLFPCVPTSTQAWLG